MLAKYFTLVWLIFQLFCVQNFVFVFLIFLILFVILLRTLTFFFATWTQTQWMNASYWFSRSWKLRKISRQTAAGAGAGTGREVSSFIVVRSDPQRSIRHLCVSGGWLLFSVHCIVELQQLSSTGMAIKIRSNSIYSPRIQISVWPSTKELAMDNCSHQLYFGFVLVLSFFGIYFCVRKFVSVFVVCSN